MEDHVILHELVHVYQVKNGSSTATINKEIEAFYLQYRHLKKSDIYKPGNRWHTYFSQSEIGTSIQQLDFFLDIKSELKSEYTENELMEALEESVKAFKNTTEYRSLIYDANVKGMQNLQSGINLSKDCEDEEF